jgi:predicted AAA+ superfamily ATPase
MSEKSYQMRSRRTLPIVLSRMAESPVTLLEGPRSVGKSTLLREVVAACGGHLLDLDDLTTREAVAAQPSLFVSGTQPVCIDEYQKVPQVLDAIKAELNTDTRPGRFILAGSARHDSLPKAAESLTGRLTRVPVFPLSQGELTDAHEDFLERVLVDPSAVVTATLSTTSRSDYISKICKGGFPLSLAAPTAAARQRWIDDYVKLTLERDVRELSRLRQGRMLSSLLGRLAGQTAQVLNIDRAAGQIGLPPRTADSYTRLLEKVFLVYRLDAWGKTLTARSSALPKIHILDSGIAARLLRLTESKLATLNATVLTELGHLIETFAVGELLKQASWSDNVSGVGHWRTRDGDEVDLVVERDDGSVIGFEVKSGNRVGGDEFKGLRKLREATGDSFIAGFAVYLGERSYTHEDRLHVVPLDRLWTPTL